MDNDLVEKIRTARRKLATDGPIRVRSTGDFERVSIERSDGDVLRQKRWLPTDRASNVLYVDGSSGQVVGAPGSSFPAGSLPLYQLTVDAAARFQTVLDVRPATAGMQATIEVVSNTAYRASYGNSFSFNEVTPQNSGAYSIQIGG